MFASTTRVGLIQALCCMAGIYADASDAPRELTELEGACGPISVWLVLTRHGIVAKPSDIIRRCNYTPEFGSFAVCLAEALQDFGLRVHLHSDPDQDPNKLERSAYQRVTSLPAVPLSKLLRQVEFGASVLVSYLARGGDGHFSPLSGAKANKVLLPYTTEGMMLRSEFTKRWQAPGILRQAIVAT